MYSRLADRLTERRVFGEVILKLKPPGTLAERGKLLLRRGVYLDNSVHIVSAYLYVGSYVFDAYNPDTQTVIRLRFSTHHLRSWLNWDPAESRRPYLLRPENQIELLEWLCKRLLIMFDKTVGRRRLLMEMQLHEDRKATIIQCMVRQRLARNRARRQCHDVIRKIYDADRGQFFYRYETNGYKIWHKPRLLLAEDIEVPEDWEELQQNGETVYFHPKTGRYSRISPTVAAKIVQKRFRQSRSRDYRIDLSMLVKALKMIRRAKNEYISRPDHLPALCNYALYLQCIEFDFLQARRVYERAREISARNPVLLYGYALLLLMGDFYPRKKYWMMAQDLLSTAKATDRKHDAFHIAEENFFHWALVTGPRNAKALCNFALVQQYVNEDYAKAEKFFRRAINVAPENAIIVKCYEEFTNPSNVITNSERVLWKSRKTRDYLYQTYDTKAKHTTQNKTNLEELQRRLDTCGAADWLEAMRRDLGIASVQDLKRASEGALIGIGIRPNLVREIFKSVGVDVIEKEKANAAARKCDLEKSSARLIQSVFRRREARRKVRELVRKVVCKCWDESSQCYYYYNSQTGSSSWSKPALMGSEDLEVYANDGTET